MKKIISVFLITFFLSSNIAFAETVEDAKKFGILMKDFSDLQNMPEAIIHLKGIIYGISQVAFEDEGKSGICIPDRFIVDSKTVTSVEKEILRMWSIIKNDKALYKEVGESDLSKVTFEAMKNLLPCKK